METSTKTRVSNEQLLAAIMAQTSALQSLVTVLTPKAVAMATERAAPKVVHNPVRMASAIVAPLERLVGHLPECTEIPVGIKIDWLGGLVRKAKLWADSPANTTRDKVAVYFVRNSNGEHRPLFARMGSKASANAVSIYQLVN